MALVFFDHESKSNTIRNRKNSSKDSTYTRVFTVIHHSHNIYLLKYLLQNNWSTSSQSSSWKIRSMFQFQYSQFQFPFDRRRSLNASQCRVLERRKSKIEFSCGDQIKKIILFLIDYFFKWFLLISQQMLVSILL